MKTKGNYFAGNLACQNLGDCSLCDLPIQSVQVEPEDDNSEVSKKSNFNLKKILKKVGEFLAA